MSDQKVGLIILDGWGIGDGSTNDAIANAQTPVMHRLMANYPNTTLITCGEKVGLPEGQMGNSEVGHLNIGAGRIVYQELTRINKSIRDGEFFEIPVLKKAFDAAKTSGKKVHFMGLVSDGGVHSSQEHLHALCTMAHHYGLTNVFIHAFTDGRDCDPKSGAGFMKELENHLSKTTGRISSIVGRYYAMDRDNRWERIKVAYDVLVHGTGTPFTDAAEALTESYGRSITDEFIEAHTLHENGTPVGIIESGDLVINFNFRTDRPREISLALTQKAFPEYGMQPLSLQYLTMTNYDSSFKKVTVIFEKDNLVNTLGEIISKMERTQVRIAETEKYPHVTFFFNGGRENEFKGESRILVNSPKVATYDLQPEMSANEVKNRIIEAMEKQTPDFFLFELRQPRHGWSHRSF